MAIECSIVHIEKGKEFDLTEFLPIVIAGALIGAVIIDATTTKTIVKL